ncbi:RNA polymerase sigma factor [Fimbriiglobus ruber]|uniref:ECF RNA polymerase sigma factor SigE n=1 Tax=Fimbriiglobus ruber TaxID=1908690 RepID=A0A225D9V6_9BACT|nr:RNA polymerase sigma factor [Fimbriiglobus ruber]OWK38341.1 hypothetical protein FRUB_07461 [Fimbriiglobus ruber]
MSESLVRIIQAVYAAPAAGASDADLLSRIAGGTDDLAFELLIRRHAGLVWRVCRAVTRDYHAAEDAFQATFLALARKAKAVRGPVPAWLYQVAYHAALKARPAQCLPTRDAAAFELQHVDPDTAAFLHDELNALPDIYRVPVVLCHLHGLTQVEVAKQLGLPIGTVATRVRRGLDRLRDRLVRRGVAAPAGAIALLAATEAPAVAPALIATAAGFAGSAVAIPATITRLSEGAISAMKPFKWKLTTILLLAATAAVGAAVALGRPADEPAANKPAAPAADKPAAPARGPAAHWQSVASRENLRKIAIAVHDYNDEHGHVPKDITDKDGRPLLSWRVAILPQLEQDVLYDQFKFNEPWDSPHNRRLIAYMPRVFRASAQKATDTYIKAIVGPGAIFDPTTKVTLQSVAESDGMSLTLMLVEAGSPVPWTKPADILFDPKGKPPVLEGPFTDAVHVVTGDGATHRLSTKPDPDALKNYIGRNDGRIVDLVALEAPNVVPSTDAEKKEFADSQKDVVQNVRLAAGAAEDRFSVEQELRKRGPLPQPDPSKARSLDELDEITKRVDKQRRADSAEYMRLIEQLRKIAPKAAESIEFAHKARMGVEERKE